MLASPAVRTAADGLRGLVPALFAGAACICAVFFSGGDSDAPLVWIGGIALLTAAVALVGLPPLPRPALLFLGSLVALAVWCGLSSLWSMSPERTWLMTNRTLVYAAFALLGVVVGSRASRAYVATGAAALLGALVAWALLAKCVPALYSDYGRLARLRAPLVYWNELALLCDAGVPLALWLASRRRASGVVLLYGLTVTLLLTYSRFGVVLACLAAVAWLLLDRARLEGIVALVVGGGLGAAVFGVALALSGITSDAQSRATRDHDGWIFALVTLAGAALAGGLAHLLAQREVSRERRARVERLAAIAGIVLALAAVGIGIAFAGRIWHQFTNPSNTQVVNSTTRLGSAKSDRWTWWQEAWHAWTRHPGGGTGAGTFELTNQMLRHAPVVVDEPHNTPLQFLTETGIVGFLLFLGTAAGALWGAWRARADPAALALGVAVAAFLAHTVVDKDWNYVGACGPLLLVAGVLVSPLDVRAPARRLFVAVAATALALAAVYSLAAPWLAQREVLRAASAADLKRAHSYDPVSVDVLTEWATFEDAGGNVQHADELYRDATSLEPENATTWLALGSFYFEHKQWLLAYKALNTSYTYDRFGPAAQPCGLLDQARKKAFGYVPPKLRCRAGARSSSP